MKCEVGGFISNKCYNSHFKLIKLTQKDKSLILLIASTIIVLWGIFSFFSYLFSTATVRLADVNKIITGEKQEWFNVSRPLELEDLKDRVILLDFWTYACVNCIQALPEIKELEREYGSKLVVIGVHSAKFNNEKESAAIRKAILKYDINHPVVNDGDLKIWNSFEIKAWPSFVLINPHGKIFKTYAGEGSISKLKAGVKKVISKYKYEIEREALPILLEKSDLIGNVLSFPTKLEYIKDFAYKNHHAPALAIANSAANNIVISSLTGDIIVKIGSGSASLNDGNFESASFNAPQGLLYKDQKLYVADKGNHALRVIDFREEKVSTLIGAAKKGEIISDKAIAVKGANLASPTDIEFFPNNEHIAIANSGTHQILSYDLKNQTVAALAGSGVEGIDDGKYPQNSLAQTSDMAAFAKKLYFVDSETSSLRVLNENGEVATLIGSDLFKFGHANGGKEVALMQHPLGLAVDDTGVYIADSFNQVIRKYDFSTKKISDLIGSKKRGDALGKSSSVEFDEPEGIIASLGNFYIADSNNNRIVVVSRANLNASLLNVIPPLKLSKEGFLEYLPNLHKEPTVKIKADSDALLKITLQKGWEINENGPSFINLLELVKDDQANLIATFDWNAIARREMKLPKLKSGKDYVLQGVIYYCEDIQNALCYVKSYEQQIIPDKKTAAHILELKLGE